ncbi:exosortase/archaeosortase family protein [Sphingomonas daechungensis]|uniref:Exosortase/archaeosortase family protein n=1 Tax=Sphingomonas daechungensis TaxID=1176646 RepID=A0ABX6SZV8_9SPHN|nr:exosortase/archaeosortase family protein [Sphingomonas daechungensis]
MAALARSASQSGAAKARQFDYRRAFTCRFAGHLSCGAHHGCSRDRSARDVRCPYRRVLSAVRRALVRSIWFPLFYLALTLPPPDSVVAAITQPIKIIISEWAVSLLHALGYPIASSG